MKRRYSMWRLRFNPFQTKAQRRLGKDMGDGKLQWSDMFFAVGVLVLLKPNLLPEHIPYRELLQLLAGMALMFVGIFLVNFRRAPLPRYGASSWSVFLLSIAWSVAPFVFYWVSDSAPDLETIKLLSLSSAIGWLIFLVLLGCYYYIRRRSRIEIERLRLMSKRRRREQSYE